MKTKCVHKIGEDDVSKDVAEKAYGSVKALLSLLGVDLATSESYRRVWVNSSPHSLWLIGDGVSSADTAIRAALDIAKAPKGGYAFEGGKGGKATLSALTIGSADRYNIALPAAMRRRLDGVADGVADGADPTPEAIKAKASKIKAEKAPAGNLTMAEKADALAASVEASEDRIVKDTEALMAKLNKKS